MLIEPQKPLYIKAPVLAEDDEGTEHLELLNPATLIGEIEQTLAEVQASRLVFERGVKTAR